MENMMAKSAATFSDSQPFTTEMQKTMTTNNVTSISPSSITADTTATPSKAGTKGASKSTQRPLGISPMNIMFVIILVVFLCMCAYICNHRRKVKNVIKTKAVGDIELQHNPMKAVSDIELQHNPMKGGEPN